VERETPEPGVAAIVRRRRAGRAVVTPRALALAGCLVLGAAAGVPAQTPDTVALEELTWTEVRDLVRAGATTVLVPIGGTEQNGPHMALGKHNRRVRALAERIARALGSTLVAPVLAYVPEGGLAPPTGHMRYPGTLTIPEETFRTVLEYAARSLRLHGFRDIVLLGDSGSTQAGQQAVARRLNREWAGSPGRVHAGEAYYRASDGGVRDLLRQRGYRPEEVGTHAALADTSLLLAVDPRLVRPERLAPGTGLGDGNGVDGDPTRASAELGRLGVERIVAATVAAIQQARAPRPAAP
jgi:creatinine amidohydrolase/Fe(II)-dependent formamide hydrolase-like protein